MNAPATFSYASVENSSVTFTLMPSKIACSIAGSPSSVPGILIITLGRSTRRQYSRTCARVASVSCAPWRSTSREIADLRERRLGVGREVGHHLERHVAVVALGVVVQRAQHVGGHLHVAD